MPKLQVNSVLAHASLSHEFETGMTLITGKNTSGKTSLARILAALTTHDANPAHVSAAHQKVYVQDGALEGMARLGEVIWRPPGGVSAPVSQAPTATPHAVGLVDFVRGNRSAKERAKLWEGLFLPDNPLDILRPHWPLPESQLSVVIDVIRERGWEAAAGIYEAKRMDAKRRWEQVTGAGRYGPKKAVEWVPMHWRTELEGAAETDLQARCVDLRDQIQHLGARQTIEQAKIDEAKRVLMEDVPRAEHELQEAEAGHEELRAKHAIVIKKVEEAEKKRFQLAGEIQHLTQLLNAVPPLACPHCGGGLEVSAGNVHAWTKPDPETLKDAAITREQHRASELQWQECFPLIKDDKDALGRNLQTASAKVSEIKGRIHELRRQTVLANAQPYAADEARRARLEQELEEANKLLVAHQQFYTAKREHDNIVELDAVCSLLGPTGARAQHMRIRMDDVRTIMGHAAGASGWEVITILDDYSITSDNRPITLAAHNEQLKAQFLCQVASAMLTDGEWLVLDQADLLRDESWQGLVNLLERLAVARPSLHIVVCATSTLCPEGWDHVRLEG